VVPPSSFILGIGVCLADRTYQSTSFFISRYDVEVESGWTTGC
jgi:hypothetical protein